MSFWCFTVYKKHYPPALNDEVWRLEKIGKDGSFHKRLNKAGIVTVEDFLRLVVRDSQRLRNVRMWDSLPNIYICSYACHVHKNVTCNCWPVAVLCMAALIIYPIQLL